MKSNIITNFLFKIKVYFTLLTIASGLIFNAFLRKDNFAISYHYAIFLQVISSVIIYIEIHFVLTCLVNNLISINKNIYSVGKFNPYAVMSNPKILHIDNDTTNLNKSKLFTICGHISNSLKPNYDLMLNKLILIVVANVAVQFVLHIITYFSLSTITLIVFKIKYVWTYEVFVIVGIITVAQTMWTFYLFYTKVLDKICRLVNKEGKCIYI